MYDVFLTKGCRHQPSLEGVEQQFPELIDLNVAKRATGAHPGFLGFDLDNKHIIHQLMGTLRMAGAQGEIVFSKYRNAQSTLKIDEAMVIAEENLRKEQNEHLDLTYGKIRLIEEGIMWFQFASPVKEWRQQGYIPGAYSIFVDKLDGHIWQDEEFDLLLR